MKNLTYGQKALIYRILGYLASIGVPIGTAAIMFPPEIVESTSMSISATVILTLIIGISAFRKKLAELFSNYSVIMTYAVIAVISVVAVNFFSEMLTISLVGLGATIGAMPLFKLGDNNAELAKLVKEEELKAQVQKNVNGSKEE